MSRGEFITRLTIWITMFAYVTGSLVYALARRRDWLARIIWSVALGSLLFHVASAFHFYHGWSHASAYADTARQVNEVVGVSWGGGIYFNYALMAFWTLDVCWWWLDGLEVYRRRPRWLMIAWQAFLIFMFFNATFVFGHGAIRWIGLVMCLSLCVAWWIGQRPKSNVKSPMSAL